MKGILKRLSVLTLAFMLVFTTPVTVEAKGTKSYSANIKSNGLLYKSMPKAYRGGYKAGRKQFKKQNWQQMEMTQDILMGKSWYLEDHPAVFCYNSGYPGCLSIQQSKQTFKIAKQMVKKAKGKGYKKALALHNALIKHTSYQTGTQYSGQTAYEALVGKACVCAGYARAYKLLCDIAGIPCYSVYGNAGGGLGGGGAHQWNIIKLGGKWYEVDVTFDEGITQGNKPSKEFFCLSTAQMSNYTTSAGMSSYHQRGGMDQLTNEFMKVVPTATASKKK